MRSFGPRYSVVVGFLDVSRWAPGYTNGLVRSTRLQLERKTVITGHVLVRSDNGAPVRFVRKNSFPEGWEDVVSSFLSLFHRYAYIYKPLSGGSWLSANEEWRLSDTEILKAIACLHPRFYLGCRSSKSTRFAVIDIDSGSRYHNHRSLEKLLRVLSVAGLTKSSLYRSSYSGGWHLYIFFDEPIACREIRQLLARLLSLNEFQISKGQLEIFPNPGAGDSVGLGLRLPLQQGFAWLDKRTLEVDYERHELSPTKALELFIDAIEADTNPYSSIRQLKAHIDELEKMKNSSKAIGGAFVSTVIPIRNEKRLLFDAEFSAFVKAIFHQLPPGIIVDNWYKGRLYHLNGLTGTSQRAEAIECIGHYFFYGDPSRDMPALGYGYEQERQWVIEQFLNAKHNGQSRDINQEIPDALGQVERAAYWKPAHRANSEPTKYSAKRPIPWIRANANKRTNARLRISKALEKLKTENRSFSTEDLRKKAGCGRDTLYKHTDIWRKDYDDLANGFFAACTDEYNDVEGAAPSESMPPSASFSKNMPIERLAARQIVSELRMRYTREHSKHRKKAVAASKPVDEEWQAKVESTLKSIPADVSPERLKALIVVLMSFLSLAPTEEQQKWIQGHIERIRIRLTPPGFQLRSAPERPPP